MLIKADMLPVPMVLAVLVNNWGVEGSRRLLCGLLLRQQVTLQPSTDTACLCDGSLCKSASISGVYPHFDIIWLNRGFFHPYCSKTNKLVMCVVLQQPEPVVNETAHEVVLRAFATGLLDGIGINHLSEAMQQNHTSLLKKQPHGLGAESGPVVPTQTKTPKTKSSWGVTRGLHVMSHTQASRGESSIPGLLVQLN